MKDERHFSDELLNAYVDEELASDDRRVVEQAMQQDEALRERVAELKQLKQLVKSAYADEASVRVAAPLPRRWWTPASLAASMAAFALGVALSWGLFSYLNDAPGARIVSAPSAYESVGTQAERAVKVLFHLNRNDSSRLNEILDEAETLLMTASFRDLPVSVRIIASGTGLSLFGNEPSANAERINAMKKTYQRQLTFNGCSVAYKQLTKRTPGGKFELLPVIELVDLGVLELMRRQREGWAYIRL